MSSFYPSLPVEPMGSYYLPLAFEHRTNNGRCPVCEASWKYLVDYKGSLSRGIDPEPQHCVGNVPTYAHVLYACGGVWREIDGYWEGRCGLMKTKQLELQLEAE